MTKKQKKMLIRIIIAAVLLPHHMVSIIPVQKNWNATEHYHRAMRCMEEIHARGKIAIVTGRTGKHR